MTLDLIRTRIANLGVNTQKWTPRMFWAAIAFLEEF